MTLSKFRMEISLWVHVYVYVYASSIIITPTYEVFRGVYSFVIPSVRLFVHPAKLRSIPKIISYLVPDFLVGS